jgi:hypothetical protein
MDAQGPKKEKKKKKKRKKLTRVASNVSNDLGRHEHVLEPLSKGTEARGRSTGSNDERKQKQQLHLFFFFGFFLFFLIFVASSRLSAETSKLQTMKRGASSELEGEPSEKAAKEDPLLVFLQDLSAEDASEWHDVLLGWRVRSLDDLVGLAQAEEAWNAFYAGLAQQEPVLASKLLAWRQGLGIRAGS